MVITSYNMGYLLQAQETKHYYIGNVNILEKRSCSKVWKQTLFSTHF